MNPMIKELAEEAGFMMWGDEAWRPHGEVVDWSCRYDSELEKFAELLIKECINIVDDADMSILEGPDPDDVLYVACKQIKEHFGVE